MIVCTKCLTQNADGKEFCQNAACGAYLPFWGTDDATSTSGTIDAAVPDEAGKAGVKVVVGDDALRTSPGHEVVCEARVCNTGSVPDEFLLNVFGEPSQWSIMEPARIALEPGEERTATARLRPPDSVVASTRRIAFGIGAMSTHSPGVFVVKEQVLELVPGATELPPTPTPGFTIVLTPAEVVCDAGGTAVVQVRLRNTGSVIDELDVDVLGVGEWASAEPARLPLALGQEATSTVTFSPPRGPQPPAGAIAAAIKVSSSVNPAVTSQQPILVTIRPFTEIRLALRPERAESGSTAPFELWLENSGNVAVEDLTISGKDAEEQLRFAAVPPGLSVPPGEWSRSVVSVTPRKHFYVGRAKPRTFELAVGGADAARRTIGGTLVQKPRLPWWMLAILGALAVLVAMIVRALGDQDDIGGSVVALLAAIGLVIGLLIAGLAVVTGSLGRLFRPGPDPMSIGATFLVGLGGLVAAVIVGYLGHALFGDAGAVLAIPAAIVTAVVLVGTLGRNRSELPPPMSRPPEGVAR